MNTFLFEIKKLHPDAIKPSRGTPKSAAIDLYACFFDIIPSGSVKVIKSGIAVNIHDGYCGRIASRSSLAMQGIDVVGGLIDPDYTGELCIIMRNSSKTDFKINKADRIAQMTVDPVGYPIVVEVQELSKCITERGDKGLGSTGK